MRYIYNLCCFRYIFFSLPIVNIKTQNPFEISFIHLNDFHAKYEPINVDTRMCQPGDNEKGLCYGGIARVVTILKELQETEPNPVLLNAGDSYQGSLLYSLFKWNITLEFMNRIPFDATALGNHEFDDGISGVLPYFKGLKSPLVAVNIDSSTVPELQRRFHSSIVIQRQGRYIGIIGCIIKHTPDMANTGSLKFIDEVRPVTIEAKRLRSQGVAIVVLLSHSGYETDQLIAREVSDIDIIVGAHSHSFLYTGKPPSVETVSGEYPTVVKQTNGRTVLIVQAFAFSKYVGVLRVQFDPAGEIISWSGSPRLLNASVQEDPETKRKLQPWIDEANVLGQRTLGSTKSLLDSVNCWIGECTLGNFLTDAMVAETGATLALMNAGAMRAPIGESPNITYRNLLTSQPFANSIDTIELTGRTLWRVFETSVTVPWPKTTDEFTTGPGCMQVSGIQPTYNFSKPVGQRVVSLLVRCVKCASPLMEPIELDTWYIVAMSSFLSNGGNGFSIISEQGRNKTVGYTDIDVFSRYITKRSPIHQTIEGRMKVVG